MTSNPGAPSPVATSTVTSNPGAPSPVATSTPSTSNPGGPSPVATSTPSTDAAASVAALLGGVVDLLATAGWEQLVGGLAADLADASPGSGVTVLEIVDHRVDVLAVAGPAQLLDGGAGVARRASGLGRPRREQALVAPPPGCPAPPTTRPAIPAATPAATVWCLAVPSRIAPGVVVVLTGAPHQLDGGRERVAATVADLAAVVLARPATPADGELLDEARFVECLRSLPPGPSVLCVVESPREPFSWRETALALRSAVRRQDVVARLGHRRYGVVAGGLDDPADVGTVVARVQQRMVAEVGHPVLVGAVVRAVAPLDEDALAQAAEAVATAAGDERGWVVVGDVGPSTWAITPARIRRALAEGDIGPWFQPIHDLATGAVVGAEALARWTCGGETIPPARFLPALTAAGWAPLLTLRMLEATAEWVSAWDRAGLLPEPFSVSVNCTASELDGPDLVDTVERVLTVTGVRPDRLSVEVTETEELRNRVDAVAHLVRMRDAGLRIALDDFGTGYSSLSRLGHLPVHVLKIDGSFTSDLGVTRSAEAIVHAVARVARTLGMTVVAEGIETAAQRDHLRRLGIGLGQGFFLGRPIPPADFRDGLTKAPGSPG